MTGANPRVRTLGAPRVAPASRPTRPAHTPPANPQTSRPASAMASKTLGSADAGERLSKRVMQLKACSRAQAEQYITDGWVQVDGAVVQTPQLRVRHQTVVVDPDATLQDTTQITVILHKPAGWQDGVYDQGGLQAKDSRSLLTLARHWAQDASGIRPLVRHLDRLDALVPLESGASGLLVFTQDWRTRRKLSEDMASMEHEVLVDVAGAIPNEALQNIARALNNERNPLPLTKFSVSSSTPERSTLRFAIKGAHPGLAAHLCDRAGLQPLAMRRIRLGRVLLRDLPPGQWRYLSPLEKF